MALRERIQLLLLLFLLILGLTTAVGVVSVGRRDQLIERAATYGRATDDANMLLTAYMEQQAAARASSGGALPEDYVGERAAAQDIAGDLRGALRGNDSALQVLDAATAAGEAWDAAVRQGQTEQAALFKPVRDSLTALRSELEEQEQTAQAALGSARRQLNVALTIALVDGAALVVATSVALHRWSTRPLDEISAAMREVSGGSLERRIPAVGPADIAGLGRDAEVMRRRIVAERDAARRAEQALRSSGAIVSLLRKELGPSGQALPPALTMAAGFEPVKGVLAGDWYDVLPLADGSVALCLIDVSGHGQSTGIFALQAKNLLVAGARQLADPGDVLAFVARALGDTGDHFLTSFIARIDPKEGVCDYASAGHLPALVTRNGAVEELGPTGPLLGPLPATWESRQVSLSPGSLIVAYTDGITEARGRGGEEYGEERLRAVVAARAREHPTNVITTCLDTVHDFAAGEATDDLTIVAVRWLPRD